MWWYKDKGVVSHINFGRKTRSRRMSVAFSAVRQPFRDGLVCDDRSEAGWAVGINPVLERV